MEVWNFVVLLYWLKVQSVRLFILAPEVKIYHFENAHSAKKRDFEISKFDIFTSGAYKIKHLIEWTFSFGPYNIATNFQASILKTVGGDRF